MDTIKGLRSEGNYQEIRIDPETGALIVIQDEHSQVHKGNHYFFKTWLSVPGAGTVNYFAFHTPPEPLRTHVFARVRSQDEFTAEIFYRSNVVEGTGTPLRGFNNNMKLPNISEMCIIGGPTVIDEGINFYGGKVDNHNPLMVSDVSGYAIMAAPDTCYLWKLTKNMKGATHWVDVDFWWYEQFEQE